MRFKNLVGAIRDAKSPDDLSRHAADDLETNVPGDESLASAFARNSFRETVARSLRVTPFNVGFLSLLGPITFSRLKRL